jgi:hypothetical protein
MNEQGLAAQGQMQQEPTTEQLVMKVAELMAQGVTAEQLMQQGVPKEIIDMAMQVLQSQQGQQQPQVEPVQGGLNDGGLASRGMM